MLPAARLQQVSAVNGLFVFSVCYQENAKNYSADFHSTGWRGGAMGEAQPVTFGADGGENRTLAEVCTV